MKRSMKSHREIGISLD